MFVRHIALVCSCKVSNSPFIRHAWPEVIVVMAITTMALYLPFCDIDDVFLGGSDLRAQINGNATVR